MNSSWNPTVPEVYQIETVSRCNLRCPFCPTGVAGGNVINEQQALIDTTLFETIVKRDLTHSYFVELQFRGEPTLHKNLEHLVEFIKRNSNVLTGLSTHGGLLHKDSVCRALYQLDYLTISIDAAEKERYEELRVGNKFETLIKNLDYFFLDKSFLMRRPITDLQLIEFDDIQRQYDLLFNLVVEHNWPVTIRTIQDTLKPQIETTFQHNQRQQDLCLNPWLSVSIQCDGDVVPCCMWFSKSIVYGNVKDASLKEIWNESPVVKEFRQMHLDGDLKHECKNCYAKSPTILHWNLIKNAMTRKQL